MLTIFGALAIAGAVLSFDLPANWFKAGSKPDKYDMGVASGAGRSGGNAATIQSTELKIKGFGTLMQTCKAGKYAGKRVRLRGWMKTANVKSWAAFWFRVDQEGSKHSLAFDNMYDRNISGTTDWKQYEIVLDVPQEASKLAYGALLSGTGQIWFENIEFDIVDKTTAQTGKSQLEEPANLNFNEKK